MLIKGDQQRNLVNAAKWSLYKTVPTYIREGQGLECRGGWIIQQETICGSHCINQ